MKKAVVFLILILPISCAVTATEQVKQNTLLSLESGVLGLESVDSRLPAPDSRLKPRDTLSRDEEWLKLAEPAPETPRRPWGGIFNVPAGITPPKSETGTENITVAQKASASLPEVVSEEAQSHVESPSYPELTDKVKTSSTPKSRPWGGVWYAPLSQPSPFVGEETSTQNTETPPPASWKDYTDVDFGKFASGSYSSDYANKYVKIKCRFSRIASEFIEVPKYPGPDYVTFIVTGVGSQLHSSNVVVSRADADTVFKLKPQEEIVLYGKAVQIDLHTLTMEVRKIER